MNDTIDIRIPLYPECWETCGACASGAIEVIEVCIRPGERVACEQTLIVLETGKTALDIPCSVAGQILAIHLKPGDHPEEGALIVTLRPERPQP